MEFEVAFKEISLDAQILLENIQLNQKLSKKREKIYMKEFILNRYDCPEKP